MKIEMKFEHPLSTKGVRLGPKEFTSKEKAEQEVERLIYTALSSGWVVIDVLVDCKSVLTRTVDGVIEINLR